MSETLYRKYRPQKFSDIVDENHVKITLKRAIAQNKIAHAYLFTGPRGIGKTTTARILAKAVNCLSPQDGEPCNKCEICQQINQGNFLDLVELDAASRRRIDEIREFKELIKYPPNQAKYKVFIIDEVHMLTDVSFNALLKTLEEPPAHSIFILCTTEVHKVPITVISRCQRFDFKKLSINDIVDNLSYICRQEKIEVDKEVLTVIARKSDGCLRDAQSLLGQVLVLGEKKIGWEEASAILPQTDTHLLKELWQTMVNSDIIYALQLVEQANNSGLSIVTLFDDLLEFLRLILLYKIDSKINSLQEMMSPDDFAEVVKQINLVDVNFIKNSLEILIRYRDLLKVSPITSLPLELALLEIINNYHKDKNNKYNNHTKSRTNNKNSDASEVTTKKEEKLSSSKNNHSQAQLSSSQWQNIIDKMKDTNFSLAGILRSAALIDNSFGNFTIAVSHQIHKDIINKEKNIKAIRDFLQKETGHDIKINIVVKKVDPANQKIEQDDIETGPQKEEILIDDVDKIINAFGGQVIESGVIEE